jgi:hypothetical protein
MSTIISKQDKLSRDKLSGWDKMIQDAKQRIARLELVIQDCEEKKATGEPWPGDQKKSA